MTLALASGHRVLPSRLDAERCVLGGVLLHPRALVDVLPLVRESDFYHPGHGAIYAAMVALDGKGRPVDQLTVADEMRTSETFGVLRALNGEAYFAELTSAVLTIENIAYHARMVAGVSRARRLIETCQEIAAKGYGDYGDLDDFLEDAERNVCAVTAMPSRTGGVDLCDLIRPTMNEIEKAGDRPEAIVGVSTGLKTLDGAFLGWEAGTLSIIAARPAMGKTTLIMRSLILAAEAGVPSFFFSAEMKDRALVKRLLADRADVNGTRIRTGRLGATEWAALHRAAGDLGEMPLRIDHTASPTIAHIRSEVRRWWGWVCRRWERLRREDPNAAGDAPRGQFAIDYLGLVNTMRDKNETDAHAMGRLTKALLALAKDIEIPVIALSQLSRAVESRSDKRPQLSDLRESGEIEQDAELVAFIYRDEIYNKASADRGKAEIIIRKQRNGPPSTVMLGYEGSRFRFYDLAEEQREIAYGGPRHGGSDDGDE